MFEGVVATLTLNLQYAGMVELVDSEDLGSSAERCVGSSPTTRTNEALTWILIGKLPPAEQCAS